MSMKNLMAYALFTGASVLWWKNAVSAQNTTGVLRDTIITIDPQGKKTTHIVQAIQGCPFALNMKELEQTWNTVMTNEKALTIALRYWTNFVYAWDKPMDLDGDGKPTIYTIPTWLGCIEPWTKWKGDIYYPYDIKMVKESWEIKPYIVRWDSADGLHEVEVTNDMLDTFKLEKDDIDSNDKNPKKY